MNKRIRRKRVRRMLLSELAVQFAHPNDAIQWLETPVSSLDGRTPREAIAGGDEERVIVLLGALKPKSGTGG